ncbi:TetR/AcrR family transcriptional regulator [Novosphingobium arvoryzae]|uniref:TetR family transcriptional regulator n=1 Tax=Novosphingobium arvoryzae TaxID=1256514 RepID=A0A918RNH3_9SPHN|nr:TetR/AcrR family transcriptional regulator [Novosphingobium arvoryzae]GHA05145.1 TetR family transcriptional regulator [Novosphingobium arvoryzae]
MNVRTQRLSRSESQAQTRIRLAQAARHEFARRGVAAASIDRISESAGYSRGAFYSNFADKHELLLELQAQHQAAEIDAWQALLDAEGSLAEVLPALQRRFDAFARNADDFLFQAELQLEALRNPQVAERYRAFSAEIATRTRQLAQAFITRAGGCRVSADVLGILLQSLAHQLITEARLGAGAAEPSAGERMVAILTELLGTTPDAA